MIPLRDSTPSGSVPVVTILLIIANALMFMYELSLGQRVDPFIMEYGLTPAKAVMSLRHGGSAEDLAVPLFTSIFMHGGWMHIIGNMWFLWIFGDNIEDRLGHVKYLIFYLLCGVGASMVHVFFYPFSDIPTIGASGAISGVLGAYLLSYPRARIKTLIFIIVFVTWTELPAYLFLLMWFVFQFLSGASQAGLSDVGGVAYWAHVGGFVIGMLLIVVFPKNPERHVPSWSDERRWMGRGRY